MSRLPMSTKYRPVRQRDDVDPELAARRSAAELEDELDADPSVPLAAVLLRWCGRHPWCLAFGVVFYAAVIFVVVTTCMGAAGGMPSLPTSSARMQPPQPAQPAPPGPPKPDPPSPEAVARARLQALLQGLPKQFYDRSVEERAEILSQTTTAATAAATAASRSPLRNGGLDGRSN